MPTPEEQPVPTAESGPAPAPVSFPAAAAALTRIQDAVRTAQTAASGHRAPPDPGTGFPQADCEQALAALLTLRRVRDQLAGWETALIETARTAGASWAALAAPLGVASRQAAERRYLRGRPGVPGATGEQRVRATRERRAADRTVASWARDRAFDLRQLAGRITALPDLPAASRALLAGALADSDAARLVGPLLDTRPHLAGRHPELAESVETLARNAGRLRRDADARRADDPADDPAAGPGGGGADAQAPGRGGACPDRFLEEASDHPA
ncbi:type III effector protein [Streptomyces qinglanensis]|uniref:type III effector protein n=1 Tax=Streptomyces qinglanensis TaxID=943816 RepID=UPI003788C562